MQHIKEGDLAEAVCVSHFITMIMDCITYVLKKFENLLLKSHYIRMELIGVKRFIGIWITSSNVLETSPDDGQN